MQRDGTIYYVVERRREESRGGGGEEGEKGRVSFRCTDRQREEWKSYFHNILNCFRVGEMRAETPKENVAGRIVQRRANDFHRSILADCSVTLETQRFFAI